MDILYVFGAGGSAKETLEDSIFYKNLFSNRCYTFDELVFIEDKPKDHFVSMFGKHYEAISYDDFRPIVYGGKPKDIMALVTPVDYKYRKRVYADFPDLSYMHSIAETAVVLSDNVGIGFNIRNNGFVGSTARIGKFVKVNYNGLVPHDCDIKDYVYISMNVSLGGSVTVGEGAYIFEGSCIRPGIKIGKNSVIGAGSVVTKDVPDNVIAYGNPCKVVRDND